MDRVISSISLVIILFFSFALGGFIMHKCNEQNIKKLKEAGEDDIVYRLRKRAEIRRQISTRKSVQEGKPDRISDLLEEAANEIANLRKNI